MTISQQLPALVWNVSSRIGLFLWVLLFVVQAAYFRLTSSDPAHVRILLMDIGWVSLMAMGYFLLDHVPRIMRVFALSGIGIGSILWVFASVLHATFFGSVLRLSALSSAGLLIDARESVFALLTLGPVCFLLCVPMLLLGLSVHAAWQYGTRKNGRLFSVTLAALFVLCFAFSSPNLFFQGEPVKALHLANVHPMLSLFEDALSSMPKPDKTFHAAMRSSMLRQLPSTLNRSGGYKDATRPLYPFFREPLIDKSTSDDATQRLNVVVVLLESVRSFETGLDDYGPDVTPHLNQLAKQALSFQNAYAASTQTVRGEVAVLCSVVPYPSGSSIYGRFPNLSIPCLPDILSNHGYGTYWINMYSADYAHKRRFLLQHGIQEIHDSKRLKDRVFNKPHVGWGPSDEDLFDYAIELFDRAKQPFFAEIMTLSNHHPFRHEYGISLPSHWVPKQEDPLYQDYLWGVYYTDYALGTFFEMARTHAWFDNTIFVIVGDHGASVYPERVKKPETRVLRTEMYFRTPLLFFSPKHIKANPSHMVATQIDIAPTLLDMLNIQAANSFFGSNLIDMSIPNENRFAFMYAGTEEWSFRKGNTYCYAHSLSCMTQGIPQCAPNETGAFATHACFHTPVDLFSLVDEVDSFPIQMPAKNAEGLLAHGQRLYDYTVYVLENNALAP